MYNNKKKKITFLSLPSEPIEDNHHLNHQYNHRHQYHRQRHNNINNSYKHSIKQQQQQQHFDDLKKSRSIYPNIQSKNIDLKNWLESLKDLENDINNKNVYIKQLVDKMCYLTNDYEYTLNSQVLYKINIKQQTNTPVSIIIPNANLINNDLLKIETNTTTNTTTLKSLKQEPIVLYFEFSFDLINYDFVTLLNNNNTDTLLYKINITLNNSRNVAEKLIYSNTQKVLTINFNEYVVLLQNIDVTLNVNISILNTALNLEFYVSTANFRSKFNIYKYKAVQKDQSLTKATDQNTNITNMLSTINKKIEFVQTVFKQQKNLLAQPPQPHSTKTPNFIFEMSKTTTYNTTFTLPAIDYQNNTLEYIINENISQIYNFVLTLNIASIASVDRIFALNFSYTNGDGKTQPLNYISYDLDSISYPPSPPYSKTSNTIIILQNTQEIKVYTDFIYDMFAGNVQINIKCVNPVINLNLKDITCQKQKRGIVYYENQLKTQINTNRAELAKIQANIDAINTTIDTKTIENTNLKTDNVNIQNEIINQLQILDQKNAEYVGVINDLNSKIRTFEDDKVSKLNSIELKLLQDKLNVLVSGENDTNTKLANYLTKKVNDQKTLLDAKKKEVYDKCQDELKLI